MEASEFPQIAAYLPYLGRSGSPRGGRFGMLPGSHGVVMSARNAGFCPISRLLSPILRERTLPSMTMADTCAYHADPISGDIENVRYSRCGTRSSGDPPKVKSHLTRSGNSIRGSPESVHLYFAELDREVDAMPIRASTPRPSTMFETFRVRASPLPAVTSKFRPVKGAP